MNALRLVASLPVRRLALPAAIECTLASAAPEGVAGGKTIRAGHGDQRISLFEESTTPVPYLAPLFGHCEFFHSVAKERV